jgi:hypothetical protein
MGKMPLEVELLNENNEVMDRMVRNSNGDFSHSV